MMQPWLWVWLLAMPIVLALLSLSGTGKNGQTRGTARHTGDGRTGETRTAHAGGQNI